MNFLLPLLLLAGQAEPLPERNVWLPHQAVKAAVEDIRTIKTPAEQVTTRYIWIRDPSPEDHAMVSLAVNTTLNQSTRLVPPVPVAGGHLARINLLQLAPREKDFQRVLNVWEETFDPAFHVESDAPDAAAVLVKVPRYRHPNGKWYTQKWVKPKVKNFAVSTNHDNDEAMVELAATVKSSVPIIEAELFCKLTLTSFEGGRYYDFMGFRNAPAGQTDEEFILSLAGASEAQTAALRTDERAAVWFSGVTGKPRQGVFFYGSGVRPSAGLPLITLTNDCADEDVTPETNPLKSLLNFKFAAREGIWQRANGTLAFVLFNNKGELQNVVPPNIAMDRTIPAPATANLQPPLSCIVCHGPHDGFQPFPNEVQLLLKQRHNDKPLTFLGDDNGSGDPADDLDRLDGLYRGDLTEPLRIARNSYEKTCYVICSRAGLRCEPGEYAKSLAAITQERMHKYLYQPVTPEDVCFLLGYKVEAGQGAEVFRRIVPAVPENRFGINMDDPTAIAIRGGVKIRRQEFDFVYQDLLLRSIIGSELSNAGN